MRIAALVKQVPRFEAMELGPDGRLVREGLELEMNPYCRRAVSKGVELAAAHGGTCTVITLGPPSAEDCLREAIAWGADAGVLVSDPAFAGSDTLATARALAAAINVVGPFDVVFTGRNSVDADTGQVGPGVAELLGAAFATGVKELALGEGEAKVRCEEDDGYSDRTVRLPAVLSCAERLCEPAKVDPEGRAAVAAERIQTLTAADLGGGPWGQDGSGTYVGEVRVLDADRAQRLLDGPVEAQVEEAIRLLVERKALLAPTDRRAGGPLPPGTTRGQAVTVVVEPDRPAVARELIGAAARLAAAIDGHVVTVALAGTDLVSASACGADLAVVIDGAAAEEDVAAALAGWAGAMHPWAVLGPGTTWGREVLGRAAARLGSGLTGDAIDLEVTVAASSGERRLLAWKPAFGGRLVAAIYASTPIQMATVRPGVLEVSPERAGDRLGVQRTRVEPRGRVAVLAQERDDDVEVLATATRVVCVGVGVPPDEYPLVEELAAVLGAEMAATRKVTDKGWMPRSRQVGITGRSIAPVLYVGIGLSGKFNHTVGVRAAGTVVAVNPDRDAPIWSSTDIGIVADWREVVPLLIRRLREVT